MAREAAAALEARSIPLPDNVTAALAVLDRVEASRPAAVDPTAIRRAIIDGAAADTINSLLLADLAAARLASEWRQAQVESGGAVLSAIQAAAAAILPALREQADAAIRKLAAIADLEGARLDDLVRAGRTDDARLLADVDVIAAELDTCYDMRDRYLTAGGPTRLTVNAVNASRWRNPVLAHHRVTGASAADRYVRGISAGLELWFPTPAEAIEAATQIADAQAAEAARIKASQHGIGSVAAFSG